MYVFQSRYGTHLARWLEVFPRSRILVLVQEEIQSDPLAQARRLYHFVEVDPDHQSTLLFRRSHESVGAHRPALSGAWRVVGDFGRRSGLEVLVESIKRLSPVSRIMAANRRDLRVEIPWMHRDTEQALQCELAPDLIKLAELAARNEWPWPTWGAAKAMMADHYRDLGDAPRPHIAGSARGNGDSRSLQSHCVKSPR
jgi:hypothetical protein